MPNLKQDRSRTSNTGTMLAGFVTDASVDLNSNPVIMSGALTVTPPQGMASLIVGAGVGVGQAPPLFPGNPTMTLRAELVVGTTLNDLIVQPGLGHSASSADLQLVLYEYPSDQALDSQFTNVVFGTKTKVLDVDMTGVLHFDNRVGEQNKYVVSQSFVVNPGSFYRIWLYGRQYLFMAGGWEAVQRVDYVLSAFLVAFQPSPIS